MKVAQSCPTLWDPMDSNGTLQARILEWVAFSFSRGSSPTQGSNPGLPHCRQILYQLGYEESVTDGSLKWAPPPWHNDLVSVLVTFNSSPSLALHIVKHSFRSLYCQKVLQFILLIHSLLPWTQPNFLSSWHWIMTVSYSKVFPLCISSGLPRN